MFNKEKKRALNEVESGNKESASSIAVRSTSSRLPSLLTIRSLFILLILLIMTSLGAFTYQKLFAGSTYQSETISIVEKVQELSTLATAEALVTTVIKEENNKLFNKELNVNLPGTKRTILLIVPATVLAGVDLKSISDDKISINEEKKEVSITLPHAHLLQEPAIQMDKVQTYSEEGLFRSEVNWDEGFDLAAIAQDQIKTEAVELGLLTKAEESAVKVLRQFFENLGYRTQIKFQ